MDWVDDKEWQNGISAGRLAWHKLHRSALLSYCLASQAGTKAVVCESSSTEARLHYRSHGTGLDTCVLAVALCVACASHAVWRGKHLISNHPVVALGHLLPCRQHHAMCNYIRTYVGNTLACSLSVHIKA